jgi:hypothetical protein
MFPNVRLLIAAIIVSVVALSCGFGVFAALRVNREPLARLPSAAPPLQLVATLSPAPPIAAAAVEPFDRGVWPSDPGGAVDLADAPARAPAVNDQAAGVPAGEPETPPVAANDSASSPSGQGSAAEREADPPAADSAAGVSTPAPAQTPGVAAAEAPDQSVIIDEAKQETEFVPAGLPQPAAKTAAKREAKTAGKKKAERPHTPAKTRFARGAHPDAVSATTVSDSQQSSSGIGGPFVSPWGASGR